MTIEEREQKYQQLVGIVREELDHGGIEGYGAGLIKTHFRQMGVTAPRKLIYDIVKGLDSEGYKRRTNDMQRKKQEMVVKGPDWGWSLDQHDKLAPWGFQIYAAIDVYSRNIIWCYVGVSNRTAYSVLGQFLQVLRKLGYHPRVISSDKGGEVPFVAEVQYALSRTTTPILPFEKVYRFGTSTKNQRIESWWSQLEKSRLYYWRVRIYTCSYDSFTWANLV
jgi:hypothetical protein